MKRHILLLTILILSLAACASVPEITQSPTPSSAIANSPSPSPTPSPSPAPSPSVSASPSPSASNPAYKQPAEDTVIIADSAGYIIGGYSGGKWLSPEEAAAYCAEPMAFYECSLMGRGEKTDSSGVSSVESQSITDVWTEGIDEATLFDYVYLLDIGDAEPSDFLFYAGQDRFPQSSKLSDTSSVLSAVQIFLVCTLFAAIIYTGLTSNH